MRIVHDPDGGCYGCPFYSDDAVYDGPTHYRCSVAPERCSLDRELTTRIAPVWCPLRLGAVTVEGE